MAAQNNTINIRLPATPQSVDDPKLYTELLQIYNAIKNLHFGVDQFLDIPPNYVTAPYTWSILDRGKSIDCGAGCTSVTIPADTNPSAYNPGATTVITNLSGVPLTITPAATVSLILAGTNTSAARTLANFGICTIRYISNNVWLIAGAGVA